MSYTRAVVAAVILLAGGSASLPALARSGTDVPAEFPPSSFQGRQYVDSRGCVYIRASTGGLVDWIPRVTRTRKHICNAKPTFASAQDTGLPVIPDPVPAQESTPAAVIAVAPSATKPIQPAPQARTSARVQAKPQLATVQAPLKPRLKSDVTPSVQAQAPTATPARQPRFTLSSLFTPRSETVRRPSVATAQPAVPPSPVASGPQRVVQPACGGGTAISQRYLGTGDGVRCGPQTVSPIGSARTAVRVPKVRSTISPLGLPNPSAQARVQSTSLAAVPTIVTQERAVRSETAVSQPDYVRIGQGNGRIVPRHIYEKQQAAHDVQIPEGYRPLWQDDRLNPKRAHATQAGKAAMDLIWTQTVPRQLIDRRSGRDVTRQFPGLNYPYTSFAAQAQAADPRVSLPAQRAVLSSKSFVATPKVATAQTKSQPKEQVKAYVQVALFAETSNAQRTAGTLASKGLPMRIWNAKRGGKPVQLVVAGPFADRGHAQAALSIVRRSGFGDAYLR